MQHTPVVETAAQEGEEASQPATVEECHRVIIELRRLVETQQEQLQTQQEQIAKLSEQIKLDSSNSSKPPLVGWAGQEQA